MSRCWVVKGNGTLTIKLEHQEANFYCQSWDDDESRVQLGPLGLRELIEDLLQVERELLDQEAELTRQVNASIKAAIGPCDCAPGKVCQKCAPF